ncbi:hypothetical protein ACO0RG_001543 [Hanseniaspora osmophila]|uniref:Protein FAF1 n=1 Tax=Hanseniaspora osmophila TaxID=56408 RepID=A0A1E5R0F6_9ASCO|nr:Protein FAF1 [Hanseniaspora osmophila]
MSSEDDHFKQQMELQRLAFEKQFGSLESMGFEDKTRVSSDSEQANTNSEGDSEEDGSDEGSVSASAEADDYGDDYGDDNDGDDDDDDDDGDKERDANENKLLQSQPKVTKSQPKIIKFDFSQNDVGAPVITKEERKLLKSGKSTIVKPNKPLQPGKSRKQKNVNDEEEKYNNNNDDDDDDDDNEADNLQKDIDLQNFIKDSHLLASFDPSNSSTSTHGTTVAHGDEMFGKVRMKALEQRFQTMKNAHNNVSAKKKQFQLESVPMNIRKGMLNKHMQRIAKHENFAKENGIVLSKVAKGKFRKIDFTYKKDIERRIGDSVKSKEKNFQKTMYRDKGLKINSVGRSTRNGLVISQKDIKRINGDGMSSGKKGGRGGKKSFGKRR